MQKFAKLLMLLVIASLMLAACGGESTATTAPAVATATTAPAVVPTATTAAAVPTATMAAVAPTATMAAVAPTATMAAVAPTATTAAAVEPTATTAVAAGAATATMAPPEGSKEGVLTLWVDAGRVPAVTALGKQFTEKYGVDVSIQQLNFGDIRDQLKLAGPAGEGPDIIVGAHDWLGELITNGLLEPLPNDLGGKVASFDPVSVQVFTYDGKVYGLPYLTEAVALVYNKDLVPTPPTTWEELKTMAQDLQDSGKAEQGYVLQQGDPYHSYPFWTGMGSYVFGKNADGSFNPQDLGLDNEGGQAAITEIDSMIKSGLLRKDVDYNAMMTLFTSGKSGMFFGGPWVLPDVIKSGVNFGVAPLPKVGDVQMRPFVGGQGFMVSAFGKNKLLAQTFLTEFVATDEGMKAIYDADPRPMAWSSLAASYDQNQKDFAAAISLGEPMPTIPEMSAVWDSWGKAITIVFQQQQDAVQAIKDAATSIRSNIK